jgi:hypothetical protein
MKCISMKGRKIRAVLITPKNFEKRFLDVKAQEEKDRLLQLFKSLRKRKKESIQSLKRQDRRHRAGHDFVGSGGGSRNAGLLSPSRLGMSVPERDGTHRDSEIEDYAL